MNKSIINSIVISLVTVGLFSCANENSWKAQPAASSAAATGTGSGGTRPNTDVNLDGSDYWASYPGASVKLTPTSLNIFNEYVATHPLNNPTNFRLYLDFHDVGNGRWGGSAIVGYQDNGQIYSGDFSTYNPNGNTENKVSYKDWYKGMPNAEFNQWFTWEGKQVFHGFYQDEYGAVVVVIDDVIDLGDGAGASQFSGSVWFKNFRLAPAPQYMGGAGEECWFLLEPSPYECGTFRDGSGRVSTTSALYPGDGYKKLGTFSGVQLSRAFQGK